MRKHRKKLQVFEKSLPIVAAALGRLCGVHIEFGPKVPATDGKTIFMPLPSDIDEEAKERMLGILCHECGHIRFTDMTVGAHATVLEHAIDNALEDVRIEVSMNRLYPGAERFFKKAHEPLIRKLCSQKQFEIRSLLTLFILTCAEERILRREWLKALSEKLKGLMQKHFGQKLTNSIMQLALSVREAQSTADVIVIRQKLMSLLEQEKAQAETQFQEGQCLQAKGQEQDEPSGFAPREQETSQNLSELFAENNSAVSNPLDISQSMRKVPEKQPRLQLLVDVSGRIRPIGGRERLGAERLKRAKADSVALRLALQGLVLAKRKSGIAYQDWGRRLSFNRLARLAIGSQSVFEKRTENPAPNTAIHVLLDMSGSMGKEGGDLAIQSALGLLIGLEAIRGVNLAMTVFPGAACGQSDYAVCSVLQHGKTVRQIKPAEIGAINSKGGTPIEKALGAAGMALATCKENKKIVLLITDGAIYGGTCLELVNDLQESGVSVAGIQIGEANDLKKIVANSEHISDVQELKAALFALAARFLS